VNRPRHAQIINELGKKQSMPAAAEQFECRGLGVETLFMGLGPEPDRLPEWFPVSGPVHYVESPEFEEQMGPDWAERIPGQFRRVQPDNITPKLLRKARVLRYSPGIRAFPAFWMPLVARLSATHAPNGPKKRSVWIPHGENDLLGRELGLAFAEAGFTVRTPAPDQLSRSAGTALPKLLRDETPALFLSVNFKGLDPFGLGYSLLREAGCTVATWLVDNPFSILTSLKSSYWQQMQLFMTDSSYMLPLRELGARHAHFLPLAASPKLFRGTGSLPGHARGIEERMVFVGRSEFPDKERYYAGQKLDANIFEQARAMLQQGQRPDFHWWHERLDADRLWPGNESRALGHAAEESGKAWRAMCLAATPELTIFGDEGWNALLPNADVRPPVDYYAGLPAVYREALICLNMTSMQLPAALTQRHFDVWCAGGFLLTDNTPGMGLFPEDMAQAVTFAAPDDIAAKREQFHAHPARTRELRASWEALILMEHTYTQRVASLLQTLELDEPRLVPPRA
jgi:hypothetical protein